jgi:hypothetical protein|tara:strand:- start:54 stop:455 length:402 start_codon:yes stop_codon:yes gene_type:complete
MYDTQVIVTYNDNKGYRNCLRKVTNMNLDKLNIPWEKMDSDLDEETKDELLFDNEAISKTMDFIYEKTHNNILFKELYSIAASKMFSEDLQIGLAVLFSYDFFENFHLCLIDFFNNDFSNENTQYLILKNKIS